MADIKANKNQRSKREIAIKNLKKGAFGRPKGVKNKFTDLKQIFIEAFHDLGGKEELVRWAKDKRNRTKFYELTAKMLPKEIKAELENKVVDKVSIEVIHSNGSSG